MTGAFRVWDKKEKRYSYDSFVIDEEGKLYLTYDDDEIERFGSEDNKKLYITEQSTGLKDKNGKMIFEGDKIKDKNKNIFTISYSKKDGSFIALTTSLYEYHLRFSDCCKIIGTIHDEVKS